MQFPNDTSLEGLANTINRDYYDLISLLISQIEKRAEVLKANRLSDAAFSYLALCDQLVDELKKYITTRQESFMPYFNQLGQKDAADHDCSNCSGQCTMEHGARIIDFTNSLQHIKEVIYNIKKPCCYNIRKMIH